MNGNVANENESFVAMDMSYSFTDQQNTVDVQLLISELLNRFTVPRSMPDISDEVPIVLNDTSIEPIAGNSFTTPTLIEPIAGNSFTTPTLIEPIAGNSFTTPPPSSVESPGSSLDDEKFKDILKELGIEDDSLQANLPKSVLPINESIQLISGESWLTSVVSPDCNYENVSNGSSSECVGVRKVTEGTPFISVQNCRNHNDLSRVQLFSSLKVIDKLKRSKSKKFAKVVIPRIDEDLTLSTKTDKRSSVSRSHCSNKKVKFMENSKINNSPLIRETISTIHSPELQLDLRETISTIHSPELQLDLRETISTIHSPELQLDSEIRGITPEVFAQVIHQIVIRLVRDGQLSLFRNPISGCESACQVNKVDVWGSSNDEKTRLLQWDPIVLSESINEINCIMEYKHRLKMSMDRCLTTKMAFVYQNTDHLQFDFVITSVNIFPDHWKIHAFRQLPENEASEIICKKGDVIVVTNLNLFGYFAEDSKKIYEAGKRFELVALEVAKNEKLKEGITIKICHFGMCYDEHLRRTEILSLIKADNFFLRSVCVPSSNETENELFVITDKRKLMIDDCLRAIRRNKPTVQFLTGSAGSGKTQILVDLLPQLFVCKELADANRNCNVLVITKSEYSADDLCKRLIKSDSEKCYTVVRYCDSDRIDPALISYARNANQTSTSSLYFGNRIIITSVDACYTAEFHRDFMFTYADKTYSGLIFESTIIDDANYMIEDILLMAFVTAQKLVVVSGDTYFDKNWFSEMIRKHDEVVARNVVHLTMQHRCHSKIRSCLNHFSRRLKLAFPDDTNTILPKYKPWVKPLTIVDFSTGDTEDLLEKSAVFGKLIAEYVVSALQNMNVGIVVATGKQADAIEGCSDFRSRDRILIGLTDKFCGLEKDVVIVCPAIQDNIEQFLYIAMTRAKHSVIICGDFSKISAKLLTQWADHRKCIIRWQEEPEKFPFSRLIYHK